MDVNEQSLRSVLQKIKPFWYPQLNAEENEIELTEVNQRNVSLETPLIVAAQHLQPNDLVVLVSCGAEINARSQSEQHESALHIARLLKRFDNAEMLIRLGADTQLKNAIGKTPMEYGL
jgi:ankyrin repeat protein